MGHIFVTPLVAALFSTMVMAQSAPPKPVDPPKPPAPVAASSANPAGAAVSAFQARLKEYVAFRNRIDRTVPQLKETTNPNEIAERERALGQALIKSRPHARQGEFLIKEYLPYLEKAINEDFSKRTPAERKALIVELPKGLKVGVNQIYPTAIPLATFPPLLLKVLPELPPELEYRIVSRTLILRDVGGNYVVDQAQDVFPIPAK